MDEIFQDFLHHKVNSFIKWDLIRFFHDNPHTKETAENIARYTGRDVRTVERELNDLVEVRVLRIEQINDHEIYALVDDADIRAVINDFMEACHDREFRVQAIHYVIEGMRFSPRHDF